MDEKIEAVLTAGAVKNGYIRIPSDQKLFSADYFADDEQAAPAKKLILVDDQGREFSTWVLRNRGRIKERFGAYFKKRGIQPGSTVEISRKADGRYTLLFRGNAMTLLDLFNQYAQDPPQHWIDQYRKRCEEVKDHLAQGVESFDEAFLRSLWVEVKNGISSVGQGAVSKTDFAAVLDELPSVTYQALENPDSGQLEETQSWAKGQKDAGNLSKIPWAVIARLYAAAAPDVYSTIVNDPDLTSLIRKLNQDYGTAIPEGGNWADRSAGLMKALREQGLPDDDVYLLNTFAWHLFETLVGGSSKSTDVNVAEKGNGATDMIPLNQILYGPPGTGKTYRVVSEAVRFIDPVFYAAHEDNTPDNREQLVSRYRELRERGQVEFVTFHQTFGYEEFVEGLRAEVIEGQLSYHVEPGVFRKICERAQEVHTLDALDEAIEALKLECAEQPVQMKTASGKAFSVLYKDGKTFRIKPASSAEDADYPASIENIRKLYKGVPKTQLYNPSYVQGILDYLQEQHDVPAFDAESEGKADKYVLIIDEINRGNISKILGELITLIEPSKRQGNSEAIPVRLPYSGEMLIVPNNLYIIGTMNTADRSLALLDTALRRRFDFIEVRPDPSVLGTVTTEQGDLSLAKLLQAMNERITVLYDREHTIGHAYLIEMLEDPSLERLGAIFEKRIIPLLQEYFFEDWEKIRIVLGDTEKSDDSLIFIRRDGAESVPWSASTNGYGAGDVSYQVNTVALSNIDAYKGIYA